MRLIRPPARVIKTRNYSYRQNREQHGFMPPDLAKTRIRVWRSGYFDHAKQYNFSNPLTSFWIPLFRDGYEGNVGHVSLETPQIYASLWPENLTIVNKLATQDAMVESSPFIDEKSEGRPADVKVDLSSLDFNRMEEELNLFLKTRKYHVAGSSIIFPLHKAENCSSLAYRLVKAGGIQRLVPKKPPLIITPNFFADLILKAEKAEKELNANMNSSPKI